MGIRNYTGFLAAAEHASITTAAERLNITQSALSRQIRSLEDSLGVRLFEKAGRSVRLTAAGEALLSRIGEILAAERSMRSFAADLAQDTAGLLKIGACSQMIERYLPAFLRRWRAENPQVDVRLEDGGGPELAEKLRAGKIHLTISAAPSVPDESFGMERLGRLGFRAVALAEFLPDTGQPVELAHLLVHPILTLNQRHASREVFDAACRLSGEAPRIVLESTSPHTLFAMAEGGNGVAVVPSSAMLTGRSLVSRAITLKGEVIGFNICAMWDNRAPLPLYARRFVDAVRAHIETEEAGAPVVAERRLSVV